MPKAWVASDGTIMKACPQCIADEKAIYPNMSEEEILQAATKVASEAFCKSSRTADGFQPWCKYHINLKNKERRKHNAQEEQDRKAKALENAQRSQRALQLEAEQKRLEWEANQPTGEVVDDGVTE